MKVVEMWVDCHATNGLVLWVLHGQECQWCGRLDAPLPTPEITPSDKNTLWPGKNNMLASKQRATAAFSLSLLSVEKPPNSNRCVFVGGFACSFEGVHAPRGDGKFLQPPGFIKHSPNQLDKLKFKIKKSALWGQTENQFSPLWRYEVSAPQQ